MLTAANAMQLTIYDDPSVLDGGGDEEFRFLVQSTVVKYRGGLQNERCATPCLFSYLRTYIDVVCIYEIDVHPFAVPLP